VSQIAVLATPGAAFVLSGSVSSLDMHSGSFILIDPKDDKSYEVFFDASKLPESRAIREGDHLRVIANFDSGRYVANAFTAN
jgi:hypothetical protein